MRRSGVPARIVEVPPGAAAAGPLPRFAQNEMIIVVGLCGALWRMRRSDVAIYGRVVDAMHSYVIEPEVVDRLSAALPDAAVVNACTTRRVVTTVDARLVLAQRFNADVVDMEGTHLAGALSAAGVRFGFVRVVSDDATRNLPPIADAIDVQGKLRPLTIAFAFARKPFAAWAFVQDVRSSLEVLTNIVRTISDRA